MNILIRVKFEPAAYLAYVANCISAQPCLADVSKINAVKTNRARVDVIKTL